MNKGRVGEERGGKKTDGCPLTLKWSSLDIIHCIPLSLYAVVISECTEL
jgi:hypothetical protein